MRLLAMTALIGLTGGCQGPVPVRLPEEYLTSPAIETCAGLAQTVEDVRGELLYDAEHGLRTFRPRGGGTLARASKLEIGRGEPSQALADQLRRTNHLSITADVAFDGWLLRKSVCPFLDGDTYFVRHFASIDPQSTETP